MSPVKMLSRVVSARKRLRDLSAGEVAAADAARAEAEGIVAQKKSEHEALLELDAARLASVNSVRALEILQDERHGARAALREAYAENARRRAFVEERRQALNKRERELRGSERQLDDARKERDVHINKAEQTIADELSSVAMHRGRL